MGLAVFIGVDLEGRFRAIDTDTNKVGAGLHIGNVDRNRVRWLGVDGVRASVGVGLSIGLEQQVKKEPDALSSSHVREELQINTGGSFVVGRRKCDRLNAWRHRKRQHIGLEAKLWGQLGDAVRNVQRKNSGAQVAQRGQIESDFAR